MNTRDLTGIKNFAAVNHAKIFSKNATSVDMQEQSSEQ